MIALTDADGLAVTMIAALVASLGIILLILFTLARNAGKKHEIDLEDEKTRRREKRQPDALPDKTRAEWERDPDWWQKHDPRE